LADGIRRHIKKYETKVKPDGSLKVRDHGYLWKIAPEDMGLLFPPPRVIDLLAG
jgi:hypothetical protein